MKSTPKRKHELPNYSTDMDQVPAVKQDGRALEYTPEICLAAVKQNEYALEYVKNQTPEICMAAVKEYEGALYYVKNRNALIQYIKENDPPLLIGINKELDG